MQRRRQHCIQNLEKYRTDAAQKVPRCFPQSVDDRYNNYPERAIAAGDFGMQKPINSKNKLWLKRDGPLVVADYAHKNT